jgi:hypothetical protein
MFVAVVNAVVVEFFFVGALDSLSTFRQIFLFSFLIPQKTSFRFSAKFSFFLYFRSFLAAKRL